MLPWVPNLPFNPTRMRRYMAITRIFLFLSIVNIALTAPVVVRGVHEVHVNVVDVAEDRAVTSQKRYSPLRLTDCSLRVPPSRPDYSPSLSSPMRLRDNLNPPTSVYKRSSSADNSDNRPQSEDPLTSSRVGAGPGSPQRSSSTENSVDSPQTKDFLSSISSSSRFGPRPPNFADSEFAPEPKVLPTSWRDPGPSRDPPLPEPETNDFISRLGDGTSNLAVPKPAEPETNDFISRLGALASNLAVPEPAVPETKESLGHFLKGKFKRRLSGP